VQPHSIADALRLEYIWVTPHWKNYLKGQAPATNSPRGKHD